MAFNKIKINKKTIIILVVIALLIWSIRSCSTQGTASVSKYELHPDYLNESADIDDTYAPVDLNRAKVNTKTVGGGCAMNSGIGLASSLLPREMASQEDFGQFAPDDILKGQNFLDPRNQIGMPETIGGSLRNANQQIRADPPNPKKAYEWNNSTIVPDLMQRNLCA